VTGHFNDDMKLGEAREVLRALVDEGHSCPCCTQMAKVYRRKINSTMARAMIALYRASVYAADGEWPVLHGPSLPGDTHEISQLSWWGLVEEERIRRPDGGRAGYWRVTPKGWKWVRQHITIPKYARIYDSRVLSLVGDPVNVQDCLGSRFSYVELMAGL
jgi:hypothetical protein